MPFVTVGELTYEYSEASFGKNRGISLTKSGEKTATRFQLRPNPHDNKKYNKDQPRFYLDLATAMVTYASENSGVLPPDGTEYEVLDETYTVERR